MSTDINYPSRALNSATDSVTVSGTVTSTNPAVGPTGSAVPAQADYIGINVGGNLVGAPGNSNGLIVSSAQATFTGSLASPSTGSVIASTASGVYTHFSLYLTIGTGSVQVQESNDNTNWYPVVLLNSASATALPVTSATASGFWTGDIEGVYVRVQAITNSAGTITANLELSDGPRHDDCARYVGVTAGSAIIGKVGIDQTTPGTTNGVQVNAALPAGSNVIGGVTQSGTWTVQPGNTPNTTPWLTTINQGGNSATVSVGGALKVDGSASTQPVSGTVTVQQATAANLNATVTGTVAATQSGTWTVQPGNTPNTTPWLATINQGGNSATVTAGNALKVDGSAVTQPVSGTVTANAGTGSFTVAQATAANLNATVVQATAANLNATVVQGTAANLNATVVGAGTAGTPSGGVVSVQGVSGGTAIPVSVSSQTGGAKVLLARNVYSSTNVTTTAYVQITASTSAVINKVYVADTSGSAIILAVGGAGSEVDQLYIGPGGNDSPYLLTIPASSRISIKALDTNATQGQFILTALS
jgi:hypothetical protein